jgi:hypothetical protein
MTNETLRMQFLSGVITESKYKAKLQETQSSSGNLNRVNKNKALKVGDVTTFSSGKNKGKKVKVVKVLDNGKFEVELLEKEKASLNESMIGGIVGIGAINQIPPRAKTDYETAFEHFLGGKYGLNEVEEEVKIEEGAFGDLLSRMENNTRMAADILTVITLAKEDKEGNAEKAVELLMKNHDLSEEAALEAVTRIFKKAFEWVDSMEEGKEVEDLTNY